MHREKLRLPGAWLWSQGGSAMEPYKSGTAALQPRSREQADLTKAVGVIYEDSMEPEHPERLTPKEVKEETAIKALDQMDVVTTGRQRFGETKTMKMFP